MLAVLFDIFGEELADDRAERVIAGDEEIEEGLLKVNRPSSRLIPRSRRGMQGHGGEGLFEEFVVLWLMLETDLALVQIVVDVEVAEVGSGEQGIAATDKVATDF